MEMGRKRAFRLSGSSVRPAYPGFIVMKAAHEAFNFISRPSNKKRLTCSDRQVIVKILKYNNATQTLRTQFGKNCGESPSNACL